MDDYRPLYPAIFETAATRSRTLEEEVVANQAQLVSTLTATADAVEAGEDLDPIHTRALLVAATRLAAVLAARA